MKEPERLSMSTGLPVKPKVKSYPLNSAEKEFWKFIEKHKEARKKWLGQSGDENNSESDKT